jgi:hypothetical protein
MSANLALLDRVVAHYGPEAQEAREQLRRSVARLINQTWPEPGTGPAQLEAFIESDTFYDRHQALSPQTDAQRAVQAEARRISVNFAQTRWLLAGQKAHSIPIPFLVVVVCWLAIILGSFGLYAWPDGAVIAALFVCALSFSNVIFLIVELDRPFEGWIQISSAPMREVLLHLGR